MRLTLGWLVVAGIWRTYGVWRALDCVALAGSKTAIDPARQRIHAMLLRRQTMGGEVPRLVRPGLRGNFEFEHVNFALAPVARALEFTCIQFPSRTKCMIPSESHTYSE